MRRCQLLFLGVLVISLASCMSGCTGISKGKSDQTALTEVSTVEITLSAVGDLPQGRSIGAVDFTLTLPTGVTVKADKTGETLPSAVVASGVAKGAMAVSKYTPAEGSTPGMVRSAFVKLGGFSTGEFARMNLDFTGNPPRVTDFNTTRLTIKDTDGKKIDGIRCILSLTAK